MLLPLKYKLKVCDRPNDIQRSWFIICLPDLVFFSFSVHNYLPTVLFQI